MSWTSFGDAVCDSCGDVRIGDPDRHQAIQVIRAAGWHHSAGHTIGGVAYEAILCKACVKEEHKRTKKVRFVEAQEEELPLDWGQRRNDEPGAGYTSR